MQKPFTTQPGLFVTSADLEHPGLQGLDGAEAVLDWPEPCFATYCFANSAISNWALLNAGTPFSGM
ncbi:MAG: hypothetical protein COB39_08260 [Marinosulfonomonas sp.]|nr:MAG: hypothetical protein COB39_08260 [Marinosulfonomonas sp.]